MADTLDIPVYPTPPRPHTRERLYRVLTSRRVDRFIMLLVVVNAVILGMLTYEWPPATARILVALDAAIAVVFVVEIALKLASGGRRFLAKPWNIFDTVIVALGVFGGAYPLTVLRAFRVLRTLRLVRRVPSMRRVVESFLRALPGIGSVLSVLVLVLFIYSVIGTRAFGEIAPERFGSLHSSAFTLFAVLTLEGWDGYARAIMTRMPGAWLFFVSYIAINSFVVLNLIIAVMIESMRAEHDEQADDERDVILHEIQALRAELRSSLANRPGPRADPSA